MQTQTDKKYSYLPLLITGVAVVLFSSAGIARMMGWGPNSIMGVPASATSEARAAPRCPECGMIVSMREIKGRDEDSGPAAASGVAAGSRDKALVKPTRNYEIIVRMADGSNRVINAANPARWRTGERLKVIAGTDPSLP
jgi:hypothetical protein